jgi:uncharacterized membrane protein YhhN
VKPADSWLFPFVGIALIELGAEVAGAQDVAFVTKSTLLPLLGVWFFSRLSGKIVPPFNAMLTVFAASWMGDVSLMLAPANDADLMVLGVHKNAAWFLVGVASFFLVHLRLIRIYRHVDRPDLPGPWSQDKLLFAPLVLYGLGLFTALVPPLMADPVKSTVVLPVTVYGTLLMVMVGFAINRRGRVDPQSFRLTLAGSAIFLLSDSLIGLTVLMPGGGVPLAGLWIMITYLAAEFLIAAGIVRQVEAPLS